MQPTIAYYDVYKQSTEDSAARVFLFRGPLSSVTAILGLQREAEARLLRETAETLGCPVQMYNDKNATFGLRRIQKGGDSHLVECFVIQRAKDDLPPGKTIELD